MCPTSRPGPGKSPAKIICTRSGCSLRQASSAFRLINTGAGAKILPDFPISLHKQSYFSAVWEKARTFFFPGYTKNLATISIKAKGHFYQSDTLPKMAGSSIFFNQKSHNWITKFWGKFWGRIFFIKNWILRDLYNLWILVYFSDFEYSTVDYLYSYHYSNQNKWTVWIYSVKIV